MAAIDQTSPVLVSESNITKLDWSGHGTTRVKGMGWHMLAFRAFSSGHLRFLKKTQEIKFDIQQYLKNKQSFGGVSAKNDMPLDCFRNPLIQGLHELHMVS